MILKRKLVCYVLPRMGVFDVGQPMQGLNSNLPFLFVKIQKKCGSARDSMLSRFAWDTVKKMEMNFVIGIDLLLGLILFGLAPGPDSFPSKLNPVMVVWWWGFHHLSLHRSHLLGGEWFREVLLLLGLWVKNKLCLKPPVEWWCWFQMLLSTNRSCFES